MIVIPISLIAAPLDVVSKLHFSSTFSPCHRVTYRLGSLFFLEISDIVYLIKHQGTQSTATFIEMAYFDL